MSDFKQTIRDLTGKAINRIEWVYSVSPENVGDSAVYYLFRVTLQITFMDDTYISISGESYCEDYNAPLATMLSDIEVSNSWYGSLSSRVDTDAVFTEMYDYLITYGDALEKEEDEHVYFEVW